MTVNEAVAVQVRTTGAVPPAMRELARRRMASALRHVGEPVLFARVVLTMAADPAVDQPASARAMVSVNGRPVRAHSDGATMPEAISQLAARLRIRLERAWGDEVEQARRRPSAAARALRAHRQR